MAEHVMSPRPPEYDQPIDGGTSEFFGEREVTGFLPGTSVRVWYTHLDEEFPNHWQNSMEIIVGEHGYYEISCMQTTYEVRKDEILILPPGTIHSLIPREGCTGFVYFVDTSILKTIKSSSFVSPMLANPIYITEATNHKMHRVAITLLRYIRQAYFSDNQMRELHFYAHFLNLIAEIGQHYSFPAQNIRHFRADKRKEYAEKFIEIIQYINANYMNTLTLEGIARQFGLSKYHFSRLFKQYTDYTFYDYLSMQRIKAAEYCLSEPSKSITEIAFECGFSSLSTFSRVFKLQKHCTPSEYRELYTQ